MHDGGLVRATIRWDTVADRDAYPFGIPAISSLTEAIAAVAGINPQGGTKNLRDHTRPTESELSDHLRLSWRTRPRWGFFLSGESFFSMASAFEDAEERMHDVVREDGQFVIATHSAILPAYPDAKIYKFDDAGGHSIDYEDCGAVQLTRAFLDSPQRMLTELFRDDRD